MNATIEGLIGKFLEPVFRSLPPEAALQISELTADEGLQERVHYLSGQANEGNLTDEEKAEYEALIEAGDILATLQAMARRTLRDHPP